MELFLIRHAIAEDGEDDDARPLSARGRKRFKEVVGALDALGVRFDRVLHSPKRRAVETAELLAPLVDGELEVTALLKEAPRDKLLGQLHGGAVAVVGHEPHLSSLLAWLTVGEPEQGRAFVLKKGSVAVLAGEPGPGGMQLLALWSPGALRKLNG
ncbi:MAG: phosphohistidine phosphatase SixA [Myxococcales bacterium]|nr:phosphohistidine phosphatase SixA [Myxococcales bacterium]